MFSQSPDYGIAGVYLQCGEFTMHGKHEKGDTLLWAPFRCVSQTWRITKLEMYLFVNSQAFINVGWEESDEESCAKEDVLILFSVLSSVSELLFY